jgi:hypothetical protein
VHAEGWYRDPYGLHDDRWFSDGRPSNLVRDEGIESHDEPPREEPPKPLESIAEIEVSDGRDLLRSDDAERESEYEVERDGFNE